MFRRIITSVPNFLTCCNLLSGCLACICAFSFDNPMIWGLTGRQLAWIMVGMAAVFDFFDGAAARLLHAPSPLGKELDSLADLVSFGVAPSLLLYNILQVWTGSWWVPFVALFIPAMGALRLAKFNIDTRQTTSFIGLPIPACAIFWIGLVGWLHRTEAFNNFAVAAVIILMSLMMVSSLRMFSLKFKNFAFQENFRRYMLILAAILFVITDGVCGLGWTIVFYMLLSLVGRKEA